MKSVFITSLLVTGLLMPVAEAAPNTFLNNLSGSWAGSGKAYVAKYGDISASCKVAIKGTEAQAAMNGSCGMLVFRQSLGLSLKSVGGNKFVGTYTGSRTGPAQLEGTLRGNRLVMSIKWGGVVNGDRSAQMILERTGTNSFVQIVNDRVGGVNRSTSNFTFKRR